MVIREELLPLSVPELGEEEIAEVIACLRSGWITTGPRARRLEEEFAQRTEADHAIALSSCTGAMHVVLLALEIGAGDEVILPALTWASAANMVLACGACPVFADVDPVTWNLTPAAIERALTPRTRVVMPVHFAGLPADLDGIASFLDEAGRGDVKIMEDAAHAAGGAYKDRPIGSSKNPSIAACFSFHPIKNMTTAEGGMITTGDADLARAARLWRFHGVERDAYAAYAGTATVPTGYDIRLPGFKYNLSDLHAAIGLHQLEKLFRMNERRRQLAARYRTALADVPGLGMAGEPPYAHRHAQHLFAVLTPAEAGADLEARRAHRGRLMVGLRKRNVGTGLHFEAVHLASFYREHFGTREGLCPVAEDIAARVLSLPLFPSMSYEDVEYVAEAVREELS